MANVRRIPQTLRTWRRTWLQTKVEGSASYFPYIEKTYGAPMAHWLTLLDFVKDKKHMEQLAFLKSERKIGHGHANVIVAYCRAQHEP